MSLPVNILHVMTRIPVGGVENQLLQVLRNYDRTKLNPLVVSLADKGEIGREIEAEGTDVICLNKLGHQLKWSIVTDLINIMQGNRIQIVRTHQYHANFYGRLAAPRAGVPCLVSSVHNLYTQDRKFHRRLFNRLLAKYTDRIIAVSDPVRNDILKYDRVPEDKVTVITNGVDVERFDGATGGGVRNGLGIPTDAPVIGTVGRLAEAKDQRTLIEAVSGIKDGMLPWLVIVGDGPLMRELKAQAKELGIAERTVFTGTRRDIPELLAAMDVFVLPSLREGMPNALIEALAAGRPVVATSIPPFSAIIDNPTLGTLVPVSNAEMMAKAIERLLTDHDRRRAMCVAARERAINRHSIQATVDKYMDIFKEILTSKGIPCWQDEARP